MSQAKQMQFLYLCWTLRPLENCSKVLTASRMNEGCVRGTEGMTASCVLLAARVFTSFIHISHVGSCGFN